MNRYSNLKDGELAALINSGDEIAFKEIYNRHWEELVSSAFRILKEKDACMDVVQEVFVWYWIHRETLTIKYVKQYLLLAVKYQVANYIRHEKVRNKYVESVNAIGGKHSYNEEALEIKEFKELISHFTEDLPERCKEIFYLSRNENLTNKEIANKLQISEKTVEMQITIALKRLRLKIGKFIVLFTLLMAYLDQ